MPYTRSYDLPHGRLDVEADDGDTDLDDLCRFAGRDNGRRRFLVLSKVLGRHLPAAPRAMQRAMTLLAAKLPADLPGPVCFLGLAETAVCLGQGVHAAWRLASGRDDCLYMHSTRQEIAAETLATFQEPHSHASRHVVYAPQDADVAAMRADARSLVIVDDEATTGTTTVNAAAALAATMPRLERIATATLTDWSDSSHLSGMPVAAQAVSLLRGRLAWHPDATAAPGAPPRAPDDRFGRIGDHRNSGRLGLRADPVLPEGLVARLDAGMRRQAFLVVGTGEYTYPPFLLAKALEDLGHDVAMQSTSRSPIEVGGAIARRFGFTDNYRSGAETFIYNAGHGGRRTLICHETGDGSVDPDLVARLGAETIDLGSKP